MTNKQLIDEVARLNELLRISEQQNKQLQDSCEEVTDSLKNELYEANVKIGNLETNIEKMESLIIDFYDPFLAAEQSLLQMSGMRIEKVVTFCKEVKRHVGERLSIQIEQQRKELNISNDALNYLNAN